MTEHEFWHGDMRSLSAHRKAFIKRMHYLSWICGGSNKLAFELALGTAFSKTKTVTKYPEFVDPIERARKRPKITKDNLEIEFRKQQARQQMWLHDLLNKG